MTLRMPARASHVIYVSAGRLVASGVRQVYSARIPAPKHAQGAHIFRAFITQEATRPEASEEVCARSCMPKPRLRALENPSQRGTREESETKIV